MTVIEFKGCKRTRGKNSFYITLCFYTFFPYVFLYYGNSFSSDFSDRSKDCGQKIKKNIITDKFF